MELVRDPSRLKPRAVQDDMESKGGVLVSDFAAALIIFTEINASPLNPTYRRSIFRRLDCPQVVLC